MFKVGNVMFRDFLDDVVVAQGLTLLEDCALSAAHCGYLKLIFW